MKRLKSLINAEDMSVNAISEAIREYEKEGKRNIELNKK